MNNQQAIASRLCWELERGPIPDGLLVLHKCDTPPCIRPDHLFLGTHADNARDRMEKGRQTPIRGELHGNAKLSEDQVLSILDEYEKAQKRRGLQGILASRYGVARTTVSSIVNGYNWASLREEAG